MQTLRGGPAPSTVSAKRPPAGLIPAVVEQMADEMVRRWRDGDHPVAEEFLARAPDLWDQPEAGLELIAEELALRAEFDAPVSLHALTARFPQWSSRVEALLEC